MLVRRFSIFAVLEDGREDCIFDGTSKFPVVQAACDDYFRSTGRRARAFVGSGTIGRLAYDTEEWKGVTLP